MSSEPTQVDTTDPGHLELKGHEGHEPEQIAIRHTKWRVYLPVVISLGMLLVGLAADVWLAMPFFSGPVRIVWYLLAYFPVAWPVIREGWKLLTRGDFFTEFTLMTIATLGAFAIGQYAEGVAVMLFYAIGELFQGAAVRSARSNIKALMDMRPSSAHVYRNNTYQLVKPRSVEVGETIQIKAGEKVPLDGEMLSVASSFNTAALTGESVPATIRMGDQVLAGMLNLDRVVELKVTRRFEDSALSRILHMVQHATTRKAKTELLIRRLAKVYTPIVFFLAVALVVIPFFIVNTYVFSDWLYRALIFLVISCPCALVISIPLGYFGGIGAASRNGILFKGSNFLDRITKVNTIVMDKTGTLTEGVFKVREIVTNKIDKIEFIRTLAALERKSNHPIAKAIVEYAGNEMLSEEVENIREISGHGLSGSVNGMEVLAGNARLMKMYAIPYDAALDDITETIVLVAINNTFAGYVVIADIIKEDARQTIQELHRLGIKEIVMLSGDKMAITQKVAGELGIDMAFGDLLPENKVEKLQALKRDKDKVVAFVGDGINDAPVLALSDVGIAMGAMGSDAAIETADVVIQTEHTSKIVTAIKIGRATKQIVMQNITLAFALKVIVMALGAGGLATMWEAVFADVGVALLAILNAVRIQRMDFK